MRVPPETRPSAPLTRRDALRRLAGTVIANSALAGCSGVARSRDGTPTRVRRLAKVLVSPERIIRQVAGLRPFRPSGFVLRADSLGDKPIIHNYGHGGGGVSLSWGTAQLAVDLALSTPHRDAAVLGCGVVGLSTARLLQDHGFTVTIYAKDLPPNTTSNVSGASWAPFSVADRDARSQAFNDQFVKASRIAYRYFQTLVSPRYGVWWRESYILSDQPAAGRSWENALIGDMLPAVVPLEAGTHPFGALRASRALTMHIEPSVYLPAALADYRLAAGRIVVTELRDVQSVRALPHPLVVNCTGLGAAALFGDKELVPVKGQLVVLAPQPEVDYLTLGPSRFYMMPRRDGIVLGGTQERGVWSLEPNPIETDRIIRGHQSLYERVG